MGKVRERVGGSNEKRGFAVEFMRVHFCNGAHDIIQSFAEC
jgi:hypothetical protein